ncbi:MAG: hypothetical protein CME06_01085 [Gemmatimonadetes bacterium]|nr:hypothetical protein [Gemmatimonadota bacterium]
MDQEIWQPYKDEGVVVITIGSDGFSQFNQKEQQYNTGWVWLFDASKQLQDDYGVWFYPSNLMLDQEFRLVYQSTFSQWTLEYLHEPIQEHQYDVFVHQIEPRHQIVQAGDAFSFDVMLSNATAGPRSVSAWLDAILPGHVNYAGNPVDSQQLTLPGGATGGNTLSLQVPGTAPAGDYWIRLSVGDDQTTPGCADLARITVE